MVGEGGVGALGSVVGAARGCWPAILHSCMFISPLRLWLGQWLRDELVKGALPPLLPPQRVCWRGVTVPAASIGRAHPLDPIIDCDMDPQAEFTLGAPMCDCTQPANSTTLHPADDTSQDLPAEISDHEISMGGPIWSRNRLLGQIVCQLCVSFRRAECPGRMASIPQL